MGGLARRASKIDTFRRPDQGLIILDSGDSLAERNMAIHQSTEALRPKAGTMLQAMGLMGADALVPGENELATGVAWLGKEAGHAGLPLLAANLKPARGANPFKARKLVKTGAVSVGIFGLVDLAGEPEDVQELLKKSGVRQKQALAVGRAQVKALRKAGAEVIVLMAHMPHEALKKLLEQLKGVHLAIQGHPGMRIGEPIKVGETYLLEAGRRGMELGHVVLTLGADWKAEGEPLVDDSQKYVVHQRITMQIGVLKQLLSTVDPGQAPPDTAVELNKRILDMLEDYNKLRSSSAPHTLAVNLIPLNDKVANHPAVDALIKGQEPAKDPPAGATELTPQPVMIEKGTPMKIPEEELRKIEEQAKMEAR